MRLEHWVWVSTKAANVDWGYLAEYYAQECECYSWSIRGSHLRSDWMWFNLCLWQDKCVGNVNCRLEQSIIEELAIHRTWSRVLYTWREQIGIVTQNIAEVEINIMSNWLIKGIQKKSVSKFKRIIQFLTTFVNIPACSVYKNFLEHFLFKIPFIALYCKVML